VAGNYSPEIRIRALGVKPVDGQSRARERLVAEAFVLFYVQGIRAVGIDLLITRSGVAKATFYRHFPSKDDLVLVYLDRRHRSWLAWLRESVDVRDTAEQLLAVFDSLEELFADPLFRGSATINAVAEVGAISAAVRRCAREHAGELEGYLADLAKVAGRPRPTELARQLGLLVDGAFVGAQRARDPGPARTARAVAQRLLT
jgi:AcrR family transcriptional regulator